jgi:hypothetical protein
MKEKHQVVQLLALVQLLNPKCSFSETAFPEIVCWKVIFLLNIENKNCTEQTKSYCKIFFLEIHVTLENKSVEHNQNGLSMFCTK